MIRVALLCLIGFAHLAIGVAPATAHHILGRPAYNLNEDSNTPPSMQIETLIGEYMVTGMLYPAFPQPGEQGRVSFYIIGAEDSNPYEGNVIFKVRDDPWYAWLGIEGQEEILGTQRLDDSVYRQGFIFSESGAYIVSANFMDGETPYIIDFPVQVGPPSGIGPIGLTVGALAILLIGVNLVQRRRAMSGKIRTTRDTSER